MNNVKKTIFTSDIEEFLELLFHFKVRYLIIGGEAVIYHGYVRTTGDIDFYYLRERENVNRLIQALLKFWNGKIPGNLQVSDLLESASIVQFGIPPNRIDLIGDIAGFDFKKAWQKRIVETMNFAGKQVELYYTDIHSLIELKQLADRHKDREDLIYLEQKVRKRKV
jgi:hypothetical protein